MQSSLNQERREDRIIEIVKKSRSCAIGKKRSTQNSIQRSSEAMEGRKREQAKTWETGSTASKADVE